MFDAFVRVLPELGVGGMLLLVFFMLVYRGPLYLERRNEARRDMASIEAGQYERMDARIQRLETRCESLELAPEECLAHLAAERAGRLEAEAMLMARQKADGEAQMIVSTERQRDAEARKGKE